MCPDGESNPRPFDVQDNTPTNEATPARAQLLLICQKQGDQRTFRSPLSRSGRENHAFLEATVGPASHPCSGEGSAQEGRALVYVVTHCTPVCWRVCLPQAAPCLSNTALARRWAAGTKHSADTCQAQETFVRLRAGAGERGELRGEML